MNRKIYLKKVLIVYISVLILQCIYAGATAGNQFHKPPVGRYFYIKSALAESQNFGYWDQPGNNKKFEKGVNLILNSKENETDQLFRFISAGGGFYYIESKNGGLADVAGGKNNNGNIVQIWSGHGGSNQLFRFKYSIEGRWKIYTNSGMVLCAERVYRSGSNVQIWEDGEEKWMEWYLEDEVSGRVYIPGIK